MGTGHGLASVVVVDVDGHGVVMVSFSSVEEDADWCAMVLTGHGIALVGEVGW